MEMVLLILLWVMDTGILKDRIKCRVVGPKPNEFLKLPPGASLNRYLDSKCHTKARERGQYCPGPRWPKLTSVKVITHP